LSRLRRGLRSRWLYSRPQDLQSRWLDPLPVVALFPSSGAVGPSTVHRRNEWALGAGFRVSRADQIDHRRHFSASRQACLPAGRLLVFLRRLVVYLHARAAVLADPLAISSASLRVPEYHSV
jgi:hypothetical protein